MNWKKRFKYWKEWNEHSLNSPFYKFLVLIGLTHSPTFVRHCAIGEAFEHYPWGLLKTETKED